MSSERAAPFASKAPEGWDDHVEVMRATRMFLLQKMGPTRFVVRGEESDRKFTVLVGSRARCSCGVPICLHHLFVMLKVLRVPSTNPLAWQTALIDSEVDCILRSGGGSGGSGGGSGGGAKEGGSNADAPGAGAQGRREFLRRGSGRNCAGGATAKEARSGESKGAQVGDGGGGGTRRLEIVPGEVCPVCQEEMEEDVCEDEGGGGSETGRGDRSLTFCRDGCGNNMHTRCMLMYAEHRRSSGDKACCPLCRVDWALAAVRALKEDARQSKGGRVFGKKNEVTGERGRGKDGAPAAHQAAVPVTCRSCKVKIQAAFFRCLVCTPAGSWDLCRRCYATYGVGAKGPCTPVGRRRHFFVQGEAGVDPPEWKPADVPERSNRRREGVWGGHRRGIPPPGVLSLQGREITTADFELLLALDASPTPSLHEHLLGALPSVGGVIHGGIGLPAPPPTLLSGATRLSAAPRYPHHLPPPALPLQNDQIAFLTAGGVNTGGGGDPSDANARHNTVRSMFSLPRPNPGTRSTANCRATVATLNEQTPPLPSTLSPSLSSSTSASQGSIAAAPPPVSQSAEVIAPVSGSFTSATISCCCCTFVDRNSAIDDPGNDTGSATGRHHQAGSGSLRRLPCGHTAHDACLIPILLESVGRGDPAGCLCPADSSPLFPSLSRRPSRRRRRGRGLKRDDDGTPTTTAEATNQNLSRNDTLFTSTISRTSTVANSSTMSRHERAAAARQALRKNDADHGGRNPDMLGITLVGSGLSQAPQPGAGTSTAFAAVPRGRGSVRSTVSAPAPRLTRHHRPRGLPGNSTCIDNANGRNRGGGSGTNARGGDGDGGGVCGVRECASAGPNLEVSSVSLSEGGEGVADLEGATTGRGSLWSLGGGTERFHRKAPRRSACIFRGSTTSGGGGGGGGGRRPVSHAAGISERDTAMELTLSSTPIAVHTKETKVSLDGTIIGVGVAVAGGFRANGWAMGEKKDGGALGKEDR